MRRGAIGALACMLILCGSGTAARAAASDVAVFQTSADLHQALTHMQSRRFLPRATHGIPLIKIDDYDLFQQVSGFGGSMVDSAAWLLEDELPRSERRTVMGALFGESGIRLDFLRVPMGASDFTKDGAPYSYDDRPAGQSDPQLQHFSIAHDRRYIIPALRAALSIDRRLEVLANPWSPPGWMKANDSLNNAHHAGKLLQASYGPLAGYFVKFLKAYRGAGIPVQDITPQNEPGNATIYPGLELSSPQEATFISDYLVPALRAAKLDPRIYGNDLGFSPGRLGVGFAKTLVRGPALGALAGIAWHCYFGSPYAITTLQRLAPALDEIGDECAPGVNPMPVPEEIISQLRNGARVVALWALALDPQGGPVEPPNHGCPGCTGLVTVDEGTHEAAFGPTYFELGQASAFVRPGAFRIDSNHFVAYSYSGHSPNVTAGIDDVAFKNLDGSDVLLAYNSSTASLRFGVAWEGRTFTYTLGPGATATFVWNQARPAADEWPRSPGARTDVGARSTIAGCGGRDPCSR